MGIVPVGQQAGMTNQSQYFKEICSTCSYQGQTKAPSVVANTRCRRILPVVLGGSQLGVLMKKIVFGAALLAATAAQQPAWSASAGSCYSPAAIEAEQGIRFMTELMVMSSTCQDPSYAEFRLRNREAILSYQKAMITHFRGNKAFDSWNTSLANKEAQKSAGKPSAQLCAQAAELLSKGKTFESKTFRQYAATQAASAGAQYPKCGGGKQK